MDGLGGPAALHRGIEAALRRDRLVVALSLAGVVVLAWLYLWRAAASTHMDPGVGMAMAMPALTFAMWVVMMVGMMLPSAAPTILLYSAPWCASTPSAAACCPRCGYSSAVISLVWAGFSLAAALAQAGLEHAALLTPMMESASKWLNGGFWSRPALYQLTPLKDLLSQQVSHPVQCFMTALAPAAPRARCEWASPTAPTASAAAGC